MDKPIAGTPDSCEATVGFFVYGTLKHGFRNQHWWPSPPISIRAAWTFGRLYDLVDYPAMIRGDDRVLGELWTYPLKAARQVVSALDELEGTNLLDEEDWYQRVQTQVYVLDPNGQVVDEADSTEATCYLYLRQLTDEQRIEPTYLVGTHRFCCWQGHSDTKSQS
jgi:gamma-glutamylcyclotransferase (GGCT)/AIG2-like uncharacterized protein YtfP